MRLALCLALFLLPVACSGSDDDSATAQSTGGASVGGSGAGNNGGSGNSGGSTSAGSGSGASSSGGTGSGGTAQGGGTSCDPSEHSGEGTYYSADGSGACSYAPQANTGPLLIAALNSPDWAGSAWCGGCADVQGPSGSVTVRIVDLCPECASGDLDLSPDAFDQIAARELGRVPISWSWVPCSVPENLTYVVKDGSNPWWLALQVREHRHPIAKLEVQEPGQTTWVEFARQNYNYFVGESGAGLQLPLSVRVTDVGGNVVEDRDVIDEISDFAEHQGGDQFPARCGG